MIEKCDECLEHYCGHCEVSYRCVVCTNKFCKECSRTVITTENNQEIMVCDSCINESKLIKEDHYERMQSI